MLSIFPQWTVTSGQMGYLITGETTSNEELQSTLLKFFDAHRDQPDVLVEIIAPAIWRITHIPNFHHYEVLMAKSEPGNIMARYKFWFSRSELK